jgi:hypothetical protein
LEHLRGLQTKGAEARGRNFQSLIPKKINPKATRRKDEVEYTFFLQLQIHVSSEIIVEPTQRGGFYKNAKSHDAKWLKMPSK